LVHAKRGPRYRGHDQLVFACKVIGMILAPAGVGLGPVSRHPRATAGRARGECGPRL